MSSTRQPANRHRLVPDNMPPENVDYRHGHPVLRCIEPRHPLSLSQLFGEGADPERIIRYPRYLDEPDVKCTQCNSSVKLSRIPYQNGCKYCKVKGLKIVFFCFLFSLFGCFLLGMGTWIDFSKLQYLFGNPAGSEWMASECDPGVPSKNTHHGTNALEKLCHSAL